MASSPRAIQRPALFLAAMALLAGPLPAAEKPASQPERVSELAPEIQSAIDRGLRYLIQN